MPAKAPKHVNEEFDVGVGDDLLEISGAVKQKASDRPKDGWVRIIIDEVPGLSNYEVVGVNGNVFQIKRGVPVLVPPSVVGVLETALMTNVEQRKNRITGETEEVVRHYSAIPWRRA